MSARPGHELPSTFPATFKGGVTGAWIGTGLAILLGVASGHSPFRLLADLVWMVPPMLLMGIGIGYCLAVPPTPPPPELPVIRQPMVIAPETVNRLLVNKR